MHRIQKSHTKDVFIWSLNSPLNNFQCQPADKKRSSERRNCQGGRLFWESTFLRNLRFQNFHGLEVSGKLPVISILPREPAPRSLYSALGKVLVLQKLLNESGSQ